MTTQELEDVIHGISMVEYMRELTGDDRSERESVPRVTWTESEDIYACEYDMTGKRPLTICTRNGERTDWRTIRRSFNRMLTTLRWRLGIYTEAEKEVIQ